MGNIFIWASPLSSHCELSQLLYFLIIIFIFIQPLAEVVKYVEKGYRMEAPDGCPPRIYEIMKQAWELDPQLRPAFSTISQKLDQLRANTS